MILKLIYRFCEIIRKGFNKIFLVPGLKKMFGSCGYDVRIAYDCDIKPPCNVYIGNHSQIGPHSLFWTTCAKIKIGNYVIMGPNATIITGDHRTDMIGKHIIEMIDDEKLPENDLDVVIEDGVWICSNVTILKGVTIGEGSVLASSSVVTKSTEPYGIYGGVPARKIKDRFTPEKLEEHIKLLKEKY